MNIKPLIANLQSKVHDRYKDNHEKPYCLVCGRYQGEYAGWVITLGIIKDRNKGFFPECDRTEILAVAKGLQPAQFIELSFKCSCGGTFDKYPETKYQQIFPKNQFVFKDDYMSYNTHVLLMLKELRKSVYIPQTTSE